MLERRGEDPTVEVGEDLHDQLVDGLMAVELVDVDRDEVSVQVRDHGGDLGQCTRKVGKLHPEPAPTTPALTSAALARFAHRETLPGGRFRFVAGGRTRGEPNRRPSLHARQPR